MNNEGLTLNTPYRSAMILQTHYAEKHPQK